MFYILSKILKVILMPMTWVLGLLIVAAFVKNKKWRNGLVIASVCLLLLITNRPLQQWAEYKTTQTYENQQTPQQHYKVAIIMGGFGKMNKHNGQFCPYKDRGARLWEPIRLFHMGIVDKVLVTGDATVSIDKKGHTTLPEFKHYLGELGIPDTCIIAEPYAVNTRENATRSIAILDSMGYHPNDCLLVTSAVHMKRSADCFDVEGWSMDQFAVNCTPKPIHLHFRDFVPSQEPVVMWNGLINEWAGNIIYRIVGYK